MRLEKGSFEMMKQLNERIILQQIRDHNLISRAEIAKQTQLTPPTVSKVVLELMDAGLILETEMGESTGGRRPILLTINPKGGYAIGVAISAGEMEVMITDLQLQPVVQSRLPLKTSEPHGVCTMVEETIHQLIQKAQLPSEKILGVGVAVQGIVDRCEGIALSAPKLGWENVPIRQRLEKILPYSIHIDNDLHLMAAGESWRGGAVGRDYFAYVNVDDGVGAGIMLNGQLLRGASYSAGAIGHTVVEFDGPLCHCGKRGCLETMISLSALEGMECDRIRQTVATYLGRGLATLIHVLDLRYLLLGGRVLQLADGIIPAIQEEVSRQVLPRASENIEIHAGELGADARILGAVTMVLSEFYEGGKRR